MKSPVTRIDKERFGPWAIVTGASSGIGKEFARQIAASGISVVLVARRLEALEEVGCEVAKEFGVQFRAVKVDLTEEDAIETIEAATRDLDVGLLTLGEGLQHELKKIGLNVTVLLPGATDTQMLTTDLGMDPDTMPMKPMSVGQCVAEGLAALSANRATHIAGRMNRIMGAVVPRSAVQRMMGKMIAQALAAKPRQSQGYRSRRSPKGGTRERDAESALEESPVPPAGAGGNTGKLLVKVADPPLQ